MADESQQPAPGNAASDTSALDTNQAAAVFANLLGGSQDEPIKKDEPAEIEAEKPEIEAEGAEEVEGEEKPAEKMFTVKDIGGNDIQVSESELINGYKAQKASTQKYEAAAALRKEAEAEAAKARQERMTAAQGLQQAQAVLLAQEQEAQNIDWQKLLESDPVEYLKQQRLSQDRQAKLSQNHQTLAQLQQAEEVDRAKALESRLAVEHQALLDKLPAWKDESKAKAEREQIAHFLTAEVGYTPDDVKSIIDHRAVMLARDAMLYRQMMSKAQAAAKKVSTLPQKVERPGVADNSQGLDKRATEWQKFNRSGRVEDAAAIFSRIL